MEEQAIRTAQQLVWILTAFCALSPMRWAIPALGVLASIDPSGPAFASATDVGIANAVRIVILPTFLLWRLGFQYLHRLSWLAAPKAWLLLTAYAALACAWGPYQLAGAKMIGYFYAYTVTYMLFGVAWMNGWLNPRVIQALIWTVLALAVLQTLAFGNVYGTDAGRFTSFTSPQGFAAFLLCAVSILVFQSRRSAWCWVTMAAALAGILFSGSRYVFVGLTALVAIASIARLYRSGRGPSLPQLAFRGAIGATLAVGLFVAVGHYLPESRPAQLVNAVFGRASMTQDIGTFAWRLGVYEATLHDLRSREAGALVFGTGTSSGADLVLAVDRTFQSDTISANRVLHNEFLRVTYEWGIAGLGIFLAFLGSLVTRAWRGARQTRSPDAMSLLGILPALVAGLAIENLLAGAGGATGAGFVLVMARSFRPAPGSSVKSPLWRVASPVAGPRPDSTPPSPDSPLRRPVFVPAASQTATRRRRPTVTARAAAA